MKFSIRVHRVMLGVAWRGLGRVIITRDDFNLAEIGKLFRQHL